VQADSTEPPAARSDDDGGPPRSLIIAAVVLTVAAIAAVLAFAGSRRVPSAPVAISAVPAAQADSPECQALLATLPDSLGDLPRAETAKPTPAGTAAWRGDGEPVILRCGLERPAEFVIGTPIQMVDDIGWFRIDDSDIQRSTWVSVDRPVYIALTLPADSGATPIQAISEVISRTMPAIPIRPGQPS